MLRSPQRADPVIPYPLRYHRPDIVALNRTFRVYQQDTRLVRTTSWMHTELRERIRATLSSDHLQRMISVVSSEFVHP
jgi:hypothetical protein